MPTKEQIVEAARGGKSGATLALLLAEMPEARGDESLKMECFGKFDQLDKCNTSACSDQTYQECRNETAK